ncbi:MAG TPA: hypothetical protein VK504_08145 [Vicinamibacterales bacterium]|jgi:hypothetical protein|nr:hypothetical protein [Vicinamibacterales bacterium]
MTFDEQLRRAFETLSDRHQDDIRREVQIAVDEALAAKSAADTARAVDAADNNTRLLDSVQWLGRARSLGETLDTLASAAAREAPRAAVLTIRGGRAHGWRFIGFGALDEAPPVNLEFDDAGIIATAARDNVVAVGQPSPAFAGLEPDVASIAVPLALAGDVVGILYADAESATPESRLNAGAIEILARYAARGIEAMTAFKVARSLTIPTPSPEPPAPRVDKDDDEDVAGARRYARLLVSEIKLYHEDSIAAGRRDRDLGNRLGGEIARARVLYEQRVPPHVRARAPFFDDELVRTLADGDASLLGART